MSFIMRVLKLREKSRSQVKLSLFCREDKDCASCGVGACCTAIVTGSLRRIERHDLLRSISVYLCGTVPSISFSLFVFVDSSRCLHSVKLASTAIC
jgi:hypothetical protein